MFRSSNPSFAFVPMLLLLLWGGTSLSQTVRPGSAALDGMVFVGRIGTATNLDYEEELHFNEGMLWTRNCVSCGFQPGPYWTRQVGERVHFTSVLTSASGSTFQYDGFVDGGRAEVDVRWTKDRWYWSIDRRLVFKGERAAAESLVSSAQASLIADTALSDGLPDWCP